MKHCGALADPAENKLAIHVRQQTFKIRIMQWLCTHHGVFNTHADALVDEPSHSVKSGISVKSKVVLFLNIDNQLRARSSGEFAIAAFQPSSVARITGWQHHHAGNPITLQ